MYIRGLIPQNWLRQFRLGLCYICRFSGSSDIIFNVLYFQIKFPEDKYDSGLLIMMYANALLTGNTLTLQQVNSRFVKRFSIVFLQFTIYIIIHGGPEKSSDAMCSLVY